MYLYDNNRHSTRDTLGYAGYFATQFLNEYAVYGEGSLQVDMARRSLLLATMVVRNELYRGNPDDTPDIQASQCNAILASELAAAKGGSIYTGAIGSIAFSTDKWATFDRLIQHDIRYSAALDRRALTGREILGLLYEGQAWHEIYQPLHAFGAPVAGRQ